MDTFNPADAQAATEPKADEVPSPVASEVAPNQNDLARILGVNRKTIQRWLKQPGNPGATENGYEVAAWRAWRTAGNDQPDEDGDSKAAIEKENAKKKGKLLDIEIARRLGEVTDNAKLEVWIAEMVGAARTVLLALPGILAPQLEGMDTAEREKRLREAIDDALRQLSREPWKEQNANDPLPTLATETVDLSKELPVEKEK